MTDYFEADTAVVPENTFSGQGPAPDTSTLADARDEARRILDLASRTGVNIRVIGGVGVRLRCPSADRPPLARTYKDIDFAGQASDGRALTDLFTAAGYQSDQEFNALHGRHRMFFWDPHHRREADVFLDSFTMCHAVDFRNRLTLEPETLPLSDLLLFKLQVMETNEKDYKDALALLCDHSPASEGLDAPGIARFLADDWGWWRTATTVLDRIESYAADLRDFDQQPLVVRNIHEIRTAIEREPKSRRWKLRAKIGDRKRWYETPEEARALD